MADRAVSARLLIAALAGLLFGAGLVISDLANPLRVLAFLSPGPGWDPTLAFVMIGALGVAGGANLLGRRRSKAYDGTRLPPLPAAKIDPQLLIGAALFGIGWGLAGYCPGPALVGAALGAASAWALLPGMLIGGVAARWWLARH